MIILEKLIKKYCLFTHSNKKWKSFDIFDTAITRKVFKPDHLHWFCGLLLIERGLYGESMIAWRQLRIDSERAARIERQDGEIVIEDIYKIIGQKIGWKIAEILQAIEIEIDIELANASPIDIVKNDWLEAFSLQKSVFISDFYLKADVLSKLIGACGYKNFNLQVSSDWNATKHSGKLYKYISNGMNIRRRDLVHLGDNWRSDVLMAWVNGVCGVPFSQGRSTRYENLIFCEAGLGPEASVIAGSARAARLSQHFPTVGERAAWRVATSVAGPLLTGYVLWLLIDAVDRGIDCLFFLARDGQVLVKIAENIVNNFCLPVKIKYMYASRQSLFYPALTGDIDYKVDAIVKANAKVKVNLFFGRIDFNEVIIKNGYVFGEDTVEEAAAGVADVLRAHADKLELFLESSRAAFVAYTESIGLRLDKKVAIVDLGWQGGMQSRIETALDRGETPVLLHGYYFKLFSIPARIRNRVSLYAPQIRVNEDILEIFCMADHGSTRRFSRDLVGNLSIEFAADDGEGPTRFSISSQQDGIVTFFEMMRCNLIGPLAQPAAMLDHLRKAGLAVLNEFTKFPASDEADAYGTVRHAADEAHAQFSEFAPRIKSLSTLRRFVRPALVNESIPSWRPGMLARSLPFDVMHRWRRRRASKLGV